MSNNSGGFLILLLVIVILLTLGNSAENVSLMELPQTVCGDSSPQNEIYEDNGHSQITAFAVIAVIVIFIIYCITNNQSREWR